ncbi:helix-turn-helix domain-containing protein [Niabella sp. CC-SYL272]|uniref:helix-turn-helix transcriptional regulator n=1 Tax=Niabella agricola TaxID=2891571 RepID=UPI001F457ED5|nr:helix-turn-helix domain-containing protein [Niabella agricola]MCF3109569.1 helix-turn-helix domain-containing protein [Niabella agricola]
MISENQRFRNIIRKYREHFNLTQNDMAKLMGIKESAYRMMENGRGNIDMDKIQLIARVYGLKTWELINPAQRIPGQEQLPPQTRKLVVANKDIIRVPRDMGLQLPEKINSVLDSGKLPEEFTSSDIWSLLAENTRKKVKTTRITDLLTKGTLKAKVEETDSKRSREKLYRLK